MLGKNKENNVEDGKETAGKARKEGRCDRAFLSIG
jgi:hypothetical protein